MLRKFGIIAVLSLLVTALAAVPALAATQTNPQFGPNGTHLASGTPGCAVTGDTVTCNSFQLAGVGNADAKAFLTANYTATVDCRNHGGKIVPVKASVQGATAETDQIESKNGKLVVPRLSTVGLEPDPDDFEAGATCPNGNWTKETREATIRPTGFEYELFFVDKDTGAFLYGGPYIVIA